MSRAAVRVRDAGRLDFRNITRDDIPVISRHVQHVRSRTCDYTVGGIFMWIDYFHYQYCIVDNTLFIMGMSESDTSEPAFSLPIGPMPLTESVELLDDYCRRESMRLRFSAIPADRIGEFAGLRRWSVTELTDWADYLYDITALATLSGKKLNKKRNHVNRFLTENEGAALIPLTPGLVSEVKAAYESWRDLSGPKTATANEERMMTLDILDNLRYYPFEGAVLRDGNGTVAAFTIGEIIGDTLFVHIEKMNHSVSGAGETVNKMFASRMLALHPGLRYVNREEDVGDEGLRRAKQSYHPSMMLAKYDLTALDY